MHTLLKYIFPLFFSILLFHIFVFQQPSFPLFSKALKDGINQLGGEVFIKLNWSAPVV